jgi:hypothetical protein
VELVGSYVRDLDQEDGGVVLHEREELVKVSLLDIPGVSAATSVYVCIILCCFSAHFVFPIFADFC